MPSGHRFVACPECNAAQLATDVAGAQFDLYQDRRLRDCIRAAAHRVIECDTPVREAVLDALLAYLDVADARSFIEASLHMDADATRAVPA